MDKISKNKFKLTATAESGESVKDKATLAWVFHKLLLVVHFYFVVFGTLAFVLFGLCVYHYHQPQKFLMDGFALGWMDALGRSNDIGTVSLSYLLLLLNYFLLWIVAGIWIVRYYYQQRM